MTCKCKDVQELYEKDRDLKKEDVQILQEWLKKQPHLPQFEETQVALFLHSCYYRIEPTKTTIENYSTLRNNHPEIFVALNEEMIRKTMSYSFFSVIEKATPDGYDIFLVKLLETDNFSSNNFLNMMDIISWLYIHKLAPSKGGVLVFDAKNFTLSHLGAINISGVKAAIDYLQDAVPTRLTELHVINVVPFIDRIMIIVKPLLNTRLYNMLQLHSSMDNFYKHVPKKCMPEDYGGEGPSTAVLREKTLEYILQNVDFLQWRDSQKVDESKRVEGYKNASFGADGTFKKLAID